MTDEERLWETMNQRLDGLRLITNRFVHYQRVRRWRFLPFYKWVRREESGVAVDD